MRFSRWRAAGNEYLLAERAELGGPLTPGRVCEEAAGADGILEVVSAVGGKAEVVIWNPDGTVAELSGNGTRIVARWLAERTGAEEVTVRSAGRDVHARVLPCGEIEQEIGAFEVYEPERFGVIARPATPEELAPTEDQITPTVIAWPAGAPALSSMTACTEVPAADVAGVFADANQLTRFSQDDATYVVFVRVLTPDESCASLSA